MWIFNNLIRAVDTLQTLNRLDAVSDTARLYNTADNLADAGRTVNTLGNASYAARYSDYVAQSVPTSCLNSFSADTEVATDEGDKSIS